MGTPIVWPVLSGKPTTPWLWTRFHDLFWIAGGASLLFALAAIPVSLAWPGLGGHLVVLFSFLTVVCNAPHYAATYEIIHRERSKNPAAWRTLLVSLPIFFAAMIAGAFRVELALPIVLRIFYTWSAYHYGAQHFGLASMYCAREGDPLSAPEKRRIQLAFVAVAMFQMLLLNSAAFSAVRTYVPPGSAYGGALGWASRALLPSSAYYVALALFGASLWWFGSVVIERLQAKRPVPIALGLLFAAHVAWFVIPNLRTRADAVPLAGATIGFWLPAAIPFFHCAQYLGVVGWRARTSGPVRPLLLWLALIAIGWMLFDGFGHAATAAFSHKEMQFSLVSGLVNIHHFWIDGLIWKRRRIPDSRLQMAR